MLKNLHQEKKQFLVDFLVQMEFEARKYFCREAIDYEKFRFTERSEFTLFPVSPEIGWSLEETFELQNCRIF